MWQVTGKVTVSGKVRASILTQFNLKIIKIIQNNYKSDNHIKHIAACQAVSAGIEGIGSRLFFAGDYTSLARDDIQITITTNKKATYQYEQKRGSL